MRGCLVSEMGLDRTSQEVEGVAVLLTAGFQHRQHGLDEAAAVGNCRPSGDGSARIGLAASRTGAVRLRRWLGLAVRALLVFRHGARLQKEELPQESTDSSGIRRPPSRVCRHRPCWDELRYPIGPGPPCHLRLRNVRAKGRATRFTIRGQPAGAAPGRPSRRACEKAACHMPPRWLLSPKKGRIRSCVKGRGAVCSRLLSAACTPRSWRAHRSALV